MPQLVSRRRASAVADFRDKTIENYNFGPNVIYFALGITENRPAGAFWADKIVKL